MPIYDYVCSSCRHRVEVIHGIHEAGPKYCPNCGAEGAMRKALVPPAIHFKGSGWAKKDRSSTSGARPKATSSTSSDSSGSGPSEAKPSSASGDAGDSSSSASSGSED